MARYIDADKLTYSRVRITHSDRTMGGWNAVVMSVVMSSVINNAPSADVVEVRHGEWKKRGNEKKCSVCDFIYYSNADEWSWCPNCGAKMDGERKDKDDG